MSQEVKDLMCDYSIMEAAALMTAGKKTKPWNV